MTTALLACWLMVQEDAALALPPPPPLPVLVEAGPGETLLEERWKSLAKAWGESWSRAYAERALVQPLDGHGRAEEDAPPLEPAIASSLELWARFNQPVLRYRVRFHRYVYEPLTGIETRAEGEIWWDGKSTRLDLHPAGDLPLLGNNDARKNRNGEPYKVVGAKNESCLILGQSVIIANHDDKTFLKHQDPPQMPPGLGFPVISPFRDFDPADRARIFEISPGSQHAAGQRLHLRFRGLWDGWRSHYGRVEVLLNPKTGHPEAMKVVDSRASQTVYVYDEIRRGGNGEVWTQNPFRLDLTGYVDVSLRVAP